MCNYSPIPFFLTLLRPLILIGLLTISVLGLLGVIKPNHNIKLQEKLFSLILKIGLILLIMLLLIMLLLSAFPTLCQYL